MGVRGHIVRIGDSAGNLFVKALFIINALK